MKFAGFSTGPVTVSGIGVAPDFEHVERFYIVALGPLRECQMFLDLTESNDSELIKLSDELGANIFSLCQSMNKKQNDPSKNWP